MNIGKAIKELRKEKGLSQSDLAQVTGITQAAISGIENGKRPGVATLKKICDALQISESLVYIMALEKEDVPAEKAILYESLFPIIQKFVLQVAGK